MLRPQDSDYPPYCKGYIALVPETDIITVLDGQPAILRQVAAAMTPAQETFAYAPGKWTIREMLGHMADCERVFGFRSLCFSRGDRNPLPGFDENAYVAQARFNATPVADLVDELVLVRQSNLRLLHHFDAEQWDRSGTANGYAITVRALAFLMAGHLRHHLNILGSRYGVKIG